MTRPPDVPARVRTAIEVAIYELPADTPKADVVDAVATILPGPIFDIYRPAIVAWVDYLA